jgi:hypothetical protein
MEPLIILAPALLMLFIKSKTFRRWVYGYVILYGLVCISWWFLPIILLVVAVILIATT